jgi:acyl dehydratase
MRYPEILSLDSGPHEVAYDDQYTMLYALALGSGGAAEDLPFVYEKSLSAIPTMAAALTPPSNDFIAAAGLDLSMIVHGEQRLTLHRPLPSAGRMSSAALCLSVIDKGEERGALVNLLSEIRDARSADLYATSISTLFCRGDGGFSGPPDGELPHHIVPEREPDFVITSSTLAQQAALYRLLGDRNPLHIDPEAAKAAGYELPILHGLCTYGIACRAVLRACCHNDPILIETFNVRFSAPVYPGETIETRIWRDDRQLSFECHVAERDVRVISNGLCLLRAPHLTS